MENFFLLLLSVVMACPSYRAEAQAVFSIGVHFGVDLGQGVTF